MANAKSKGSVKRLGARYGRKVRAKLAQVEAIQKAKHKCPYCTFPQVKRISAGIFECKKCKSKFTGHAYAPAKETKIKQETSRSQYKIYEEMEKQEEAEE